MPITPEMELYSIMAPLRGAVVPDKLFHPSGGRVVDSAAVPVVHIATHDPGSGMLAIALVNDSPKR